MLIRGSSAVPNRVLVLKVQQDHVAVPSSNIAAESDDNPLKIPTGAEQQCH
ncbi:6536_t:CDS:2 [Ambispora leptoticha]|uniref:6536_t:CDS:1 n=1 Tax=Ambispora leptoticha TaxID=144679 RepID=A0A9N8VCD5_9GLOM|nr:6536_t:CDS:2 [Ambispora leptoticha]